MFLFLILSCAGTCDKHSLDLKCPCYDAAHEMGFSVTCRQDQVLTVLPAGGGSVAAATSGTMSDIEIENGGRIVTCICKAPK